MTRLCIAVLMLFTLSSPISSGDLLDFSNRKPANSEVVPFAYAASNDESYNLRRANSKGELILVHGMFDTTNTLRSLGDHFFKQGFNITAPLLPGHTPGFEGFEGISFHQHVEFVREKIRERYFASGGQAVDLVGFCYGAAIVARAAQLEQGKVGRIIFFSPPIEMNLRISTFTLSDWTRYLNLLKRIFPELSEIILARGHDFKETASKNMGDATQSLIDALNNPSFDYFIAVSEADKIVNSLATIEFINSRGRTQDLLVIQNPSAPRHEDLPREISRFTGSRLESFEVVTQWLDRKFSAQVEQECALRLVN